MRLECVVVSVGYSDFLAHTLPYNKQHFDKMVIVTTSADKETQKLAEFWHVQCVITDACYENGASFNKGKMINKGLEALDKTGWVVHKDADIFLPPKFRLIMEQLQLGEEGIYGVDRLMCDDFVAWMSFLRKPQVQNENDIYVHFKPFPAGTRIAKMQSEYGGWIPIGFFQMWHAGKSPRTYPEEHTNAGRSDMLFALTFSRLKRYLIPEVLAIHLETKSEESGMGANWNGRRTPLFGHELFEPKEKLSKRYNLFESFMKWAKSLLERVIGRKGSAYRTT